MQYHICHLEILPTVFRPRIQPSTFNVLCLPHSGRVGQLKLPGKEEAVVAQWKADHNGYFLQSVKLLEVEDQGGAKKSSSQDELSPLSPTHK